MGNLDMFDLKTQVCAEAIEVFGRDAQITKAIEECAELIQILAKLRNEIVITNDDVFRVLDEVVDVEIMLEQVKQMFNLREIRVSERTQEKLDRLLLRIAAHTKEKL